MALACWAQVWAAYSSNGQFFRRQAMVVGLNPTTVNWIFHVGANQGRGSEREI